MRGDLVWTELPGGADCRVTGAFYARVFGWAVEDDGDMVRFRDPSGSLAGAFVGDLSPAGSGPLLYLEADDADEVLRRVAAAGGTTIRDRTLIAPGVGFRAILRDPAGSVVGLFEPWRGPDAPH